MFVHSADSKRFLRIAGVPRVEKPITTSLPLARLAIISGFDSCKRPRLVSTQLHNNAQILLCERCTYPLPIKCVFRLLRVPQVLRNDLLLRYPWQDWANISGLDSWKHPRLVHTRLQHNARRLLCERGTYPLPIESAFCVWRVFHVLRSQLLLLRYSWQDWANISGLDSCKHPRLVYMWLQKNAQRLLREWMVYVPIANRKRVPRIAGVPRVEKPFTILPYPWR